ARRHLCGAGPAGADQRERPRTAPAQRNVRLAAGVGDAAREPGLAVAGAAAMNLDLLHAVHWARPQLLWALLALPLILLWSWRRRRDRRRWQRVVDAHLLPHLLVAGSGGARSVPWALLLGWTLAVLALAGPGWRQQAQPLLQPQSPLVLVLDLSTRITTTDLPPSRLLQARAKLASLLRQREGGQVALVVYADDAYTVAPLTD